MKTKIYKFGAKKYKAYMKPAGKGYEVGFMAGSKSLFVGNFIHNTEAQAWYKIMNTEFYKFSKKYGYSGEMKSAYPFFHKFVSNSLYKHYYDYLDKCFGKYTKSFHREYERDVQTYNRLKRNWGTKVHAPYTRHAA